MMRNTNLNRRCLAMLCTGMLVLGMSACGGDDSGDDSSDATSATSATTASGGGDTAAIAVTIEAFAFDAQPVAAGQSFEVENKDTTAHTFTADDGGFDVELGAGATESVDGLDAGSYAFHCTIHPNMTGTLDVT